MRTKVIHTARTIDEICARWTVFKSVEELANQLGGYRPSIRCESGFSRKRKENAQECHELTALANAYDAYQIARGDKRRAYRS